MAATAKIKPGTYTVGELLDAVGFNMQDASAEYLNGDPDHRRVTVGGLGFDSLEAKIHVPPTADVVEVTLDGNVHRSAEVVLGKDDQEERKLAFEVAADADDPKAN